MSESKINLEIREVDTLEGFKQCVELQREVFALPDIEISPLRHLVVTKHAGGFVLGAFFGEKLVGFVLTVPAIRANNEACFYSHMTAISKDFQNAGIGAKLKFAQRERALNEGKRFIKWTFHPLQARNAHFNLNRLGAVIRHYEVNFYGTDYVTSTNQPTAGIDSDRLFAEWEIDTERAAKFANGETPQFAGEFIRKIEILPNWEKISKENPIEARAELLRVREEFQKAFAENLVCAGFERDNEKPAYLLYKP